jgi:hypothetical protein
VRTRALTIVLSAGVLGATLAGCGDSLKDAAVDQALEDTGVEIGGDAGLGELPDDFPADVPTPTEGVELESAIKAAGIYTMRYGNVGDPAGAIAAYKAQLEAAGFTIDNEFDNLAGEARNVGLDATGNGYSVTAVAFGPPTEAIPDGNYMGVVVEPA